MKDVNGKIQYKGEEYKIVFNLNVMEAIQDKYGSVEKWGELTDGSANDGEPNVKAVIFGFCEMLNEGIDIDNEDNDTKKKHLTLKQVGRMISEIGLAEATMTMNETVVESTKGEEQKNA